jgi:hypothetical protein
MTTIRHLSRIALGSYRTIQRIFHTTLPLAVACVCLLSTKNRSL